MKKLKKILVTGGAGFILIKIYKSKVKPDITLKTRKLNVRHCYADITKIKKLTGWQPKVKLMDGLKEIVDWAASQEAEDKLDFALLQLAKRGLR